MTRRFWHDFSYGMVTEDIAENSDPAMYSHAARDLANVFVKRDGSVTSREGTVRTSINIESGSYIFSLEGFESGAAFITISPERVTFYTPGGLPIYTQVDSIWPTPESCEVHVWRDRAFILHADVSPRVLLFPDSGDPHLTEFEYEVNDQNESLRPFSSLFSDPPALTVTPITDPDMSSVAGRLLKVECGVPVATNVQVGMLLQFKGVHIQVTRVQNSREFEVRQVSRGSKEQSLSTAQVSTDWQVESFHVRFGFPSTGCFSRGRFVLGGVKKFPNTLWFSDVGKANRFGAEPFPDKSFALTIEGRTIRNRIIYLIGTGDLIAMTEGGIFAVEGQSRQDARVIPLHQLVVGRTPPQKVFRSLIVRGKESGALYRLTYDSFSQQLHVHAIANTISNQLGLVNGMAFDASQQLLFVSDKSSNVWSARVPLSSSARLVTQWSRHVFKTNRVGDIAMVGLSRFLILYPLKSKETGGLRLWSSAVPLDDMLELYKVQKDREVANKVIANHFIRRTKDNDIDIVAKISGRTKAESKIMVYMGRFPLLLVNGALKRLQKLGFNHFFLGYGFTQRIQMRGYPQDSGTPRPLGNNLRTRSLMVRARETTSFDIIFPDTKRPRRIVASWDSYPGYVVQVPFSGDLAVNCIGMSSGRSSDWSWSLVLDRPLSLHVQGVLEHTH